jgi:hypothetical protein
MVTASSNYKPIKRGERSFTTNLSPEAMQLVLTVRDARGCTVRGAHELCIRTGFAALLKHGFLETVPKDRWLGIVCDALGIDILPLLQNAKNEAAKKGLANPARQ